MMGGALGIAARKSGAAVRVIGVGDSQDTIQKALAKGAVDDATLDLRAAVQDAEMVILCTPVRTILDAAAAVLPVCREETVVTDIGSSKAVIVHSIENFIAKTKCKAFFVGSHPITGSEKKGIEASDQVVVSGAPCVITPTQQTNIDAYRKADEFWKALGMRTVRLSPEEHDTVLARSSHVPHLVAAALIGLQSDRSLDVSGPGLRDMTRLAGGDPALWTDIVEQNAGDVARAMKELGQNILSLANEVDMLSMRGTPGAESSRERLFRFFADARQRHEKRFAQSAPVEAPPEGEDGEPIDGESAAG
jgi:prephenate dehydrogenase